MYLEVLTERQSELLPLVVAFSIDFYLADDTAKALTIGHRRSTDFDLMPESLCRRLEQKISLEQIKCIIN